MRKIRCLNCFEEYNDNSSGTCPYCGFEEGRSTAALHQLKPGTILDGKYLVGRVLGEGGFGITYLGYQMNLEIKVAIKEFYPNGMLSRNHTISDDVFPCTGNNDTESRENFEKGRQNFYGEAKRLARFYNLPGIVSVKDCFQENRTAYIVMEYVEGQTLRQLLRERGEKIECSEILKLMKPVIESLKILHDHNIIHRDINPDNLILEKNKQMKLIDFGAAREYCADSEKSMSIVFRRGYAPAEQYAGKGKQGPWTDIYALCGTIYRSVTGVVPQEAIERLMQDEIKMPSSFGIRISPEVEKVLMKGLSLKPEDRYQNLSELQQALYPEKVFRSDEYGEKTERIRYDKEDVTQSIKTEYAFTEKSDKTDYIIQAEPEKKPKKRKLLPVLLFVLIGAAGLYIGTGGFPDPAPSVTPVPTATATPEPTATATPEPTDVPAASNKIGRLFGMGMFPSTDDPVFKNSAYKHKEIGKIIFVSSLEDANETAWDISESQDKSVLCWVKKNGAYYDLFIGANGKIILNKDSGRLFSNYENVTDINFDSCVDTSEVEDMSFMFYNCENLKNLNLSGIDTGNVVDMGSMFSNCKNVKELDVSRFNTGSVVDMGSMFSSCNNLTELDVSRFNTGKVIDMSGMFWNCKSITELDVSGFDTGKVTDMNQMFYSCRSITELDLSGFDTGEVVSMGSMFYNCISLTKLDVSGFDTGNVDSMVHMFMNCENLKELDLSGFNTSHVTTMSGMFWNCKSMEELDIDGFDTSEVLSMEDMFNACENLKKLELSGFDTSKVTVMEDMFNACKSLEELDVSGFDTGEVVSMGNMFHGCESIKKLDLSRYHTGKVTNMYAMFRNCFSLTELDVSGFDTGQVTNMGQMFANCKNLIRLDLSGFDTGKVTDMGFMFYGCRNLEDLNISGFDMRNVENTSDIFNECDKLSSSMKAPVVDR